MVAIKTLSFLTFCLMAVSAHAEIIAECGSSDGYTYFPSIGLNPNQDGIFTADKISDGSIALELREDGTFDVLFRSRPENKRSSIVEGAKVFRIGRGGNELTVAVIYPMLSEVYTFMQTRLGPEVMWTTNKHSTPVLKAGAYLSRCTKLILPK